MTKIVKVAFLHILQDQDDLINARPRPEMQERDQDLYGLVLKQSCILLFIILKWECLWLELE